MNILLNCRDNYKRYNKQKKSTKNKKVNPKIERI